MNKNNYLTAADTGDRFSPNNFIQRTPGTEINLIQREGKEDDPQKTEVSTKFHLQLVDPDYLSMRKPYLDRNVPHLWDPDSALGVWRYNFRFFKNMGLADSMAGKAANLTAPFSIDSQLKAGNTTLWELGDKELNTKSYMGSVPLFDFDANFKNWRFLPFLQKKSMDTGGTSSRESTDKKLIQKKHRCEDEEAQRKPKTSFVQKKQAENAQTADPVIANRIESTKGSGAALADKTKSFMENRFGTDFSQIRIHSGEYATQLSNQLYAQAFTVGNDIYFNQGKFSPETSEGKHLLAHELTHTIQQSGNTAVRRKDEPAKPNSLTFKHHNVRVVIRNSCDNSKFGLNVVEAAFKRTLDRIFDSDCIEASRRKRIQANLVKNGYDVRCRDSKDLVTPGACAESTGFFIPANIMTLGSKAFGGSNCGDLASTILHEIIHVTRGTAAENVTVSCEASCFREGSASPDLCKNVDVFGNKK